MDEWRWEICFLPKVSKTETCWLWTGALSNGYGNIRTATGYALAHRVAYEYLIGEIPEGMELDHLCLVLNCVNPKHLEPVTPTENKHRMKNLFSECRYGHQYTPENTYITPQGYRQCRTCNRKNDAKRQSHRKVTVDG